MHVGSGELLVEEAEEAVPFGLTSLLGRVIRAKASDDQSGLRCRRSLLEFLSIHAREPHVNKMPTDQVSSDDVLQWKEVHTAFIWQHAERKGSRMRAC